ncbi:MULTISPECIES: hypothetical protein [unclassified Serratia (in: enterobacteria)]|uniref:hypothetical protein n=1 Tax=unclassified Serratia (in: enterobacteria) TaxID=2647522 RepID=UPI003B432D57
MAPCSPFTEVTRIAFALLFALPGSTAAASCSCSSSVSSPDEKGIFADRELGEKDVRMSIMNTCPQK